MEFETFNRRHLRSIRRIRSGELSTPEVARRAGVTYRQMDYWCRRGILNPVGNGNGSGSFRRWSAEDVEVVAVLGRLSAMGATFAVLGRAAGAVARALALGTDPRWLVVPIDGPVLFGVTECPVVDVAAWVLYLPAVVDAVGFSAVK